MGTLEIGLIVVYVIGFVVAAFFAWSLIFSDHLGDPFLAGFGLLLTVLIAAIWPLMVAVSPLMFLVYAVGKAIVQAGDHR